ncbi:hypothetical protein PIB30_010133, partial [Stylosanthes scabra]|nr:hypothetical protein [Stylosanthes scabra]
MTPRLRAKEASRSDGATTSREHVGEVESMMATSNTDGGGAGAAQIRRGRSVTAPVGVGEGVKRKIS